MTTSSGLPADIHLEIIREAIRHRQVVKMNYFSSGSGEFSERCIEPCGTVRYGNTWHIIAYCRLRQGYRDFRLDRMSKLSLISESCPPRERRLLEEFLVRQSSTTDTTLVKVHFSASVAQDHAYPFGWVREEVQEGDVEWWFMVAQPEAFCRWLHTYGDAVAIISPRNFC